MSEKVEKPVNVKMLYVGNGNRDLNLLHKYNFNLRHAYLLKMKSAVLKYSNGNK